MSAEPQLFRIDPQSAKSEAMKEVDFARLGFKERGDIQEWIAANPKILGDGLLIIAKEFSDFDRTNERLDLLAVGKDGRLVIIELKRDDSGTDAHWQAIKYASYLQQVKKQDIIRMFSEYRRELSEEAAEDELQNHLNEDTLTSLNNDQRIILASHRFAPEVTSAALWLNEKSIVEDQITCVQLTPYQEEENGPLYLQANTIIPVPGAERFVVTIGPTVKGSGRNGSALSDKMRAAKDWKKNDEVTLFLRGVAAAAEIGLQDDLRPNKKSVFATGTPNARWYRMWYSSSPPWRNYDFCFSAYLLRESEAEPWRAAVGFWHHGLSGMQEVLGESGFAADLNYQDDYLMFRLGEIVLDSQSSDKIANTLRNFIEEIKPVIDQLVKEGEEEE